MKSNWQCGVKPDKLSSRDAYPASAEKPADMEKFHDWTVLILTVRMSFFLIPR